MGVLQSIAGQYYSAHLRFFRQLCTAAKVDKVSMLAREVLDQGKCVVIGLQSTGKLLLCSSVWHQSACSSIHFMRQSVLCMVLRQSTCSCALLVAHMPASLHWCCIWCLHRECDGFLSMHHSKTPIQSSSLPVFQVTASSVFFASVCPSVCLSVCLSVLPPVCHSLVFLSACTHVSDYLSAVLYLVIRSVWLHYPGCGNTTLAVVPTQCGNTIHSCGAGEARTEAMVAAKGKATGEDDNDFDSFVEPAGLILSTVIGMMPGEYHDKARLLKEAQKMKLPGNPLVRPRSLCIFLCATCMAPWLVPKRCQLDSQSATQCSAWRCCQSLD